MSIQGGIRVIYANNLGRPADAGGLAHYENTYWQQYNQKQGTSKQKEDHAWSFIASAIRNSPEGRNTQQVAKNAYELFLGRPWDQEKDGYGALTQTPKNIRDSTEAAIFRNALTNGYYGVYNDIRGYANNDSFRYDQGRFNNFKGGNAYLGALTHWREYGRNENRMIKGYQTVVLNPRNKNLEFASTGTISSAKFLSAPVRQKYQNLINNFNNSRGGDYKNLMAAANHLGDGVVVQDFLDRNKNTFDTYYRDQKIGTPYDPNTGIQPLTGGFDPNYFLANNANVGTQWNQAQSSVNIKGRRFQDLDITARYGNNINTFAAAQFSQMARADPFTRGNAAQDIGEYSEAYDDLTDAQRQLYRDELLGLTKEGASGQLSIDYTDDPADNSRFENQILSNISGQELLEQDKFGTLTQDSLKFAADKLKEQQKNEQALDLYKNLPGFNEIYSANTSLANSLLGDSGIGGYLSMLGKDTEAIQENLEEQFAGVTGIPSNNSTVFNWQKWFDEEMVQRYQDMENITVEFDDTITDLDLNSETGKIQYEIQLTRMGIDPYDENGNLIDKSVALETLEANNFQRIYEIDENFKTNFIENYLKPRFDQSKSMDEFISYMDVKEDEQNIFQTQSALDSLKTLASQQSRLLLQNIQDLPGDFNYNFYFNPDDENAPKQSTYDIQKQEVTRDWNNAKRNGNSIPPGQVADRNGNNYTWNQWAYFYGLNINDKQEFARLHYKVIGAAKGFDPAADILTQEKVDDYFVDTVVPALNDARLDLDNATFMNFVTPEQFADEVLRGIDPEENEEAWKEVLEMYGLDGTEAIDEVRNVIIESVRTGSAQRIRESIKFLNKKKKTPTQRELGVNYIERESDKKFIEDENATELYKIFQNAGYSGSEDEFFDTFMPDADRADLEFLQRGLSGDFELKDINTEDPFETLASVSSFLGGGGNIFDTDTDKEKENENEPETSYFNFFGDDDEDEDYASDTGRSIIEGYTDFFK
jgi:hypothetical protein